MVFESLVADILNKYLGQYVKNLDRSQLNIGIWGGDIELKNLDINECALEDLDLPMTIAYGHLGKLTIKVPWKNLYTAPVIVSIDGLYVVVMPLRCSEYNEEKEEKNMFDAKQRELTRIEEVKIKQSEKSKVKSPQEDSFQEKLVMQIIKNLQMEIKNIHIRYEDTYTNTSSPFSFGFTLASLGFQTTDEFWVPAVLGQEVVTYHKLASIDHLALYWNCNSQMYFKYNHSDLKPSLNKDITPSGPQHCLQYLLGPVNAQARMVINTRPELNPVPFSQPKMSVSIEIEKLLLSIADNQFGDVMRLLTTLELMSTASLYRKYRPSVGIKGHVAEWWRFAIVSILETEVRRKQRNWNWQHMHNHRVLFKTYKENYKIKLKSKKIPDTIANTLEHCEKHLDIFNITVARRQAELEVESSLKNQPQTWGNWLGSFFNKSSPAAKGIAQQFEEVMSPTEKAKLYEAIGYQENAKPREYPETFVERQISFLLKNFTLNINESQSSTKITQIIISSLKVDLKQRPSAQAVKVEMSIHRMEARGVNQGLLQPFSANNVEPMISILFETNPLDSNADQVLHCTSQSMEFIYNYDTINSLVKCFETPDDVALDKLYEAALLKLEDIKEMSATGLKHAIQQHKNMDIAINIQPSYILVPENGKISRKSHLLVIDLGHFSFTSQTLSPEVIDSLKGMEFEQIKDYAFDKFVLKVSNICIVLNTPGEDWTRLLKDTSSRGQLLSPTQLELFLEKSIITDDHRLPRIRVKFELPKINVKFTDQKLIQLLRLLISIPATEKKAPPPDKREMELIPLTSPSPSSAQQALKVVTKHPQLGLQQSLSMDQVDAATRQIIKMEALLIIKEVGLEVYSQQDDGSEDQLLLKGSVCRLGAQARIRTLDTQLECYLGDVSLVHYQPGMEGIKIISSPHVLETDNLISINLLMVQEKGAHLEELYENVLNTAQLKFEELRLEAHLEALLALREMSTRVLEAAIPPPSQDKPALPAATRQRRKSSLSGILDMAASQSKVKRKFPIKKKEEDVITIWKVELNFSSLRALMCQQGAYFLDVNVQGITTHMAMTKYKTMVQASLKDVIVSNMRPDFLYNTLMSSSSDQMLKMDVVLFNNEGMEQESRDPSIVDIQVSLELGESRIIYLSTVIESALRFADHFQNAKAKVAEAGAAAAEAAKMGMEQAYEKATKILLNISLKAPIIIVPQNSKSPYALVIDLGRLKLHNNFTNHPPDGSKVVRGLSHLLFDNITVELRDMMMKCCVVDPEHQEQLFQSEAQLIEPISFDLHLVRSLYHSPKLDMPEVSLSGRLNAITMLLSEGDLHVILKVLAENFSESHLPPVTPAPPETIKKTEVRTARTIHKLEVLAEEESVPTPAAIYEKIKVNFTMESLNLTLFLGKYSLDNINFGSHLPESKLAFLELCRVNTQASVKSDGSIQAEVLFKNLILDDVRSSRKDKPITRLMQVNEDSDTKWVMTIHYDTNSTGDATLKVTVFSFSMIVYLQYFLSLSNFFLEALPQSEPAKTPALTKTDVKDDDAPKDIKTQMICFTMEKPDVVLIEDLDNINSPALILHSEISVKLIITPEVQNLTAAISDMELFTASFNPELRQETSNKIINPFTINMQGTIKESKFKRFDIELGDISLRITASNVQFLVNILSGITADPNVESECLSIKEEDYSDIWTNKHIDLSNFWFLKAALPNHAVEATENLALDELDEPLADDFDEQLLLHLNSFIITIESGLGNKTVPLLLMESSLSCTVTNWSSKMSLGGDLNLEMAYFNEEIGIWEPLLEPLENERGDFVSWSLYFSLVKNFLADFLEENEEINVQQTPSFSIELKSRNALEFTITKRALDVLTDLSNNFQAALDMNASAKITHHKAPFLVENHLGLSLIISLNNRFQVLGKESNAAIDTIILEDDTSIYLAPQDESNTKTKKIQSVLRKQEVGEDQFFNIQIPIKHSPTAVRRIDLTRASKRYYQLQQRTYPGDLWGFLVDISTVSGCKIVSFRSPVQIRNLFTDIELEVYYMLHTGNEIIKCGTVPPQKELNLPLHAVYTITQEVFFKPASSKYKVASQPVFWKDFDHSHPNANHSVLSCRHLKSEAFNFQLNVVKEVEHHHFEETGKLTLNSLGYIISLSPTAIFRNLLPYSVTIMTEGLGEPVEIAAGHCHELWACVLNVTKLKIKIPQYLEKDWIAEKKIEAPSAKEATVWLTFANNKENSGLDLALFTQEKNRTIELNLYCPFWMVNTTGLKLTYKPAIDTEQVIVHNPENSDPILFASRAKSFLSKKKAIIKVQNSEWSDKFSLDVIGSSGTMIVKNQEGRAYCIAVDIKMSTASALTKIITFSPFYLLVNNCNTPIQCKEESVTATWVHLQPKECLPFWPMHPDKKTEMLAAYADTSDDVTTPFSFKDTHTTLLKLKSNHGGISVDCNISDTSGILKFEEYSPGSATVLLVNHLDTPISYHQKGVETTYELPGKHSCLYTWDQPTGNRQLTWKCGTITHHNLLQMDGIGDFKHNKGIIYWASFLDHFQRVLLFTDDLALVTIAQQAGELEKVEQEITIYFQSIGLSLVNNFKHQELLYLAISSTGVVWESKRIKSQRYKPLSHKDNHALEMAYQKYLVDTHLNPQTSSRVILHDKKMEVDFMKGYIIKPSMKNLRRSFNPGLWLKLKRSPHHMQLHVKINSIQIDNQILDGAFPVLLAPTPLPKTVAANTEPKPFTEVSIMLRKAQQSSMLQFKYFKILIQEFQIKLAMALVNHILDFFGQEQAANYDYVEETQKDLEFAHRDLKTVASICSVEAQKNFYDIIHLSPLKVHLSFSIVDPNEERGKENIHSQFLNLILQSIGVTLTEFQDIVFKLDYFERQYQFLNNQQLTSNVISHYSSQAVKQVYMLIFGLDVIGNPMGLIMGLTTGVGDLFYEPFQGLIQGPEEFAEGLALGIRSLFGHAVGGAAGSVSRITGTLGKGLAALTMDKEYQRKRRERMNKRPADIGQGLAQSSKGLVMGVFEGITGVITKPIEGAQEEGIEGFFKGVGKGLLGIVARPTSGAIDFASGSLDVVKRATEMTDEIRRMRPPRFIKPDKVIRPYRRSEAEGNQIFHEVDKGKFVKTDFYIAHAAVAIAKCFLFVTNNRVMFVSKGDVFGQWSTDWHYTYDEIMTPIQSQETSMKIMLKQTKKKSGFFFGSKESGKLVHMRSSASCKFITEKLEEAVRKYLMS